jgi:hypothetical protein
LSDVDWIARLKTGGEFALHYENSSLLLPFRRVDLNVAAVNRHLFFHEARYNSETKMVDTTTDGNHPWVQVDMKVYMGEVTQGRYGVKLSYQRGRLPPVFAQTKTFQFGFVFETRDRTEE